MITMKPKQVLGGCGNTRCSEGSSKWSSEGKTDLNKGDASQHLDFKDIIILKHSSNFIMHHTQATKITKILYCNCFTAWWKQLIMAALSLQVRITYWLSLRLRTQPCIHIQLYFLCHTLLAINIFMSITTDLVITFYLQSTAQCTGPLVAI